MHLDYPYQIEGKHFIEHVKHISGSIYKLEQVDNDSCIMENTMEITVFQLFDNLPLNIA